MSLVSVTVHSIGLDPASNTPLVILKESGGPRALPIWIGSAEALAINLALEGVVLERPLTHDLIKSMLDGLGAKVEKIVITELKGSTFFAQIMLRSDGRLMAVDARPSDSIAIALRTSSPIFVDEEVLGRHGFSRSQAGGSDDLAERLKRIKPEEFGKFTL
jgi:hypothetical protein